MYFIIYLDPRFELLHMCLGVGLSVDARELEKDPLKEFLKRHIKNEALTSGIGSGTKHM